MLNKNVYVFKIIWSKNYLGLAVDKKLQNNRTLPITTFFFWPRENGWQLLKEELSYKPWMSKDDSIDILNAYTCLLYTSPSPRDLSTSRMPSSA